MTLLSSALTLASAAAGLSASEQAARGRRLQAWESAKLEKQKAKQARLQASVAAINYKQQATDIFKNINEIMGASVARAYSSGIDPFVAGDTVDKLNLRTLRDALKDRRKLEDNARLASLFGDMQAEQFEQAAYGSVLSGNVVASGISLQGYATALQIGGPAIQPFFDSIKTNIGALS
jgi:hypothetical protein